MKSEQMKAEQIYTLVIYFTIFLFIKLLVDLIVELHIPNLDDLNNETVFWKILIKIKDILNFVTILFVSYFLIFRKLNFYLIFLFSVVLINSVNYFLFSKKFIYLFIKKNKYNEKNIYLFDTYFEKFQKFVLIFYVSYLLINIFKPN